MNAWSVAAALYLLGVWCVLILLEVADGELSREMGDRPMSTAMRIFWSVCWPIISILFAMLAIENWRTSATKTVDR
jgi:hypothetical protein